MYVHSKPGMTDTPLSTASSLAPSFTTQTSTIFEFGSTTSASSNSLNSKPTKAHAAHVRKFFESQHYNSWKFTVFDAHCRTFADYAWSHEKIHNFWLKQLNGLLDEKTTLAPISKIKQLIRGSRRQTSRSSKAKQLNTVSTVFSFIFGEGITSQVAVKTRLVLTRDCLIRNPARLP